LKSVKKVIHTKILDHINSKINWIERDIISSISSRDSDTKSSVGDKHETSRAKIQVEVDRLNRQLNNLKQQQNILSNIKWDKNFNKVNIGALVETNKGTYFISIAAGKIQIENNDYYLISLASPIGQLLSGKSIGDDFKFRTIFYTITNIY
jgi:transcription elongation GreA/GreB family factor